MIRCFQVILFLFLVCPGILAQTDDHWVEIPLADTMGYTLFGTEYVPDGRYPPGHLFDASYATCWVSRMADDSTYPSVFVAVPGELTESASIHIFSGYGKSESLFKKNARPEKIRITLSTAIVPDGYVAEYGVLSKVHQYPYQETICLADTFGLQKISLQNICEKFRPCHQKVLSRLDSCFPFPLMDTLVIVKMEILSVYQGTVYDDICISEIFFNDCYVPSAGKAIVSPIVNVYMDEDENTLLVDTEGQKAVAVHDENESVLQIVDVTGDNRWAIVISMPGEAPGRVETQYRVIDLMNREEIYQKIKDIFPHRSADATWHGRDLFPASVFRVNLFH